MLSHHLRILSFHSLRLAVPAALCLTMGACGVVGSGVGPQELQILTSTSQLFNAADTPVAAYTCVVEPVTASMVFTDGSRSNFSNSVDWTSSDPSVVTVVPEGLGVPAQLRPLKPGTVTITASYPRGSNPVLKKSVQVTVAALTDGALTIGKQDETTLSFIPVDPSAGLTVAPASTQLVQLAVNESGITRNLTGEAQWNVCTDAGCAPATSLLSQFQNNSAASPLQWTKNPQTGANVQIHSILPATAGQHFFLQATLGNQLAQDGTTATTFCAQPLVATVPLDVENLTTIGVTGQPDPLGSNTLGYAPGSDGLLPLVRGSSEVFTLTGNFANGQTQDLSLQGQFKSSDKTVADFNYQLFIGQAPTVPNPTPNILTALASTAAGTTQITGVFPPDNTDGTAPAGQLVSTALGVKTLNGKLQSISLAPTVPPHVQATDNINSLSLYALGTFLLDDGTTFTQDVSRQTLWTVTNASGSASNSVVIVANGSPQAGTVAASGTNARADTALVNAAITPLAGQCATSAQSCPTLATGQAPNGPALTLTIDTAGDVPSPSSSAEPLPPPGSAPVQPVVTNPGPVGGSF